MKRIFLFIAIFFAIVIFSCNSSKKASDGLPLWVRELRSSFEKDNAHAMIVEYSYKGKTVYLVSSCYQCPDAIDAVYDKDKNKLCEFGGIDGRNTCPDFAQQATNKKYIWQNKNFQY